MFRTTGVLDHQVDVHSWNYRCSTGAAQARLAEYRAFSGSFLSTITPACASSTLERVLQDLHVQLIAHDPRLLL